MKITKSKLKKIIREEIRKQRVQDSYVSSGMGSMGQYKKKRTSSSFGTGTKFKANLNIKFTGKQIKKMEKSYDENDGKSFTIELLNTDPKLKKAFSAIGSDDYLELTNIDKIENTIKKITGAKDVWDSYDDHYYAGDPGYAQYFDIEGIEPKIAINKLKGKKIPLNYEVN